MEGNKVDRNTSLNLDKKEKVINIAPSSIETIDFAFFNWVNEQLDLYCTTSKGWEKVPCLWSTSERAKQVKDIRNNRDQSGQIILPLITVERTNISKDPSRKGPYWADLPPKDGRGGSLTIARRINHDKTSNFQNADMLRKTGKVNFKIQKRNDKVVYEYMTIPQRVYIDVTYKVSIWTQYQQQMNEIVQPLISETKAVNYAIIEHEGHRYEIFIGQDFSQSNNVADMAEEERKYQTDIEVKVLGHLIGDGTNQDTPKVVITEGFVEVKMPRERVIFDSN